jgi:hypothetical protein
VGRGACTALAVDYGEIDLAAWEAWEADVFVEEDEGALLAGGQDLGGWGCEAGSSEGEGEEGGGELHGCLVWFGVEVGGVG